MHQESQKRTPIADMGRRANDLGMEMEGLEFRNSQV